MLLELGLPSFNTLIINGRVNLTRQLHSSNNSVIRQLRQTLGLHVIKIFFIDFMCFFVFPMCKYLSTVLSFDQLYSPSGRQIQRNEYRKINNK